jgi:hypothetical protein
VQRLVDADGVVMGRELRNRMGVVLDFFEKASVSRVKRRECILILRFCRWANDALTCLIGFAFDPRLDRASAARLTKDGAKPFDPGRRRP